MTIPIKASAEGDIIESVIAKGDLSKLTADERNRYYVEVCRSVGLNPLTQPLAYIPLNGKLTLYAKRDCADQLRKLNSISIEIVSQEMSDGLLSVHVRAKDASGRTDEDLGVVNFPETLRGEARANAILKAVTKAKRRVTLSISGLGFLDETEIDDIPASAKQQPTQSRPTVLLSHESDTAEVDAKAVSADPIHTGAPSEGAADVAPAPASQSHRGDLGEAVTATLSLEEMAREAAMRGRDVLRSFYGTRTPAERRQLNTMKDELEALLP
jgi:hypothetical protein